jgi:hypothetical protein
MKNDHDANRPMLNRDKRDDDHLADLLPAFVNGSLDRATSDSARLHLARCPACRHEFEAWVAIDAATQASQSPILLPSRDILGRVWAEIDWTADKTTRSASEPDRITPSPVQERITMLQPVPTPRRKLSRPLFGAVAAAALAAVIVLSPVGSYAQGFLTVFTPKQVAAVPVSLDAMKSLPNLDNYGTFTEGTRTNPTSAASAAAAGAAANLNVLTPGTLPGGLPTAVSYDVLPAQSASFTFSASKAQASAAAQGKTLPAMPKDIDGSSVTVSTGAAVIASYGTPPESAETEAIAKQAKDNPQSAQGLGNVLIIGQSTAPVVTSTGVSAADLEAYLLAQPGISPDLASAIKAIGDPTTTLPIPVPVSVATSHPVNVQGVSGLSVADSTGLGGGIIWVKNGIVYGVAGTFSENDLLAVANSLH